MRVKNTILILEEKDIKESLNRFISTEGIIVNKIKFTKQNIGIKGSIKKVFTLDFSCNVNIVDFNKDKVIVKIKDVKALKINLFTIIEKIVIAKRNKISVGKYLSIDKDLISINLNIVKRKLKDLDFKIKDIEIVKEGIKIKFDYIDRDLVMLLRKNINIKKQEIAN